jgi:tetratricopeptide (TPR) repeat protein
MRFFRGLFGRRIASGLSARGSSNESGNPAQRPDQIRVIDDDGREVFITRRQWQQIVLPQNLNRAWDKPEELCNIISAALADGFRADVVEAGRHLYEIDPDSDRAACVWGIVLKDEGRLDEAESVFREFMAKHGEVGSILVNLARVHSKRNDAAKAEELLWHALEVEPNQETGLAWYESTHRERNGKEAGQSALQRIAALPLSWRAQLSLARIALESHQLDQAMAQYRDSLARAGRPVPADLLIQMSGDLGMSGHAAELVELTEPYFDVELHGLAVGNNLIKAHLDLGRVDAARRLVDQLYACKRLDWQKSLGVWDAAIARARMAAAPVAVSQALSIAMIAINRPIWLPASSPASGLYAGKPRDEFVVCFLGSSAESGGPVQTVLRQMADNPGRMSRAIPLYLAEQIYFRTRANVQTLVPILVGGGAGFVISQSRWRDEDAAANAQQARPRGDYIVVTHIVATIEPWRIELRLVRVKDGAVLATLNSTCASAQLVNELPRLARQLLSVICGQTGGKSHSFPPAYRVPPGRALLSYLLRLEQLLAVRCSTMEGVAPGFLNGEREILEANISLCRFCPKSISTRLLLAQTVSAMKKARPDIVPEFQEKLARLEREKPLGTAAHEIVRRIIEDALSE